MIPVVLFWQTVIMSRSGYSHVSRVIEGLYDRE